MVFQAEDRTRVKKQHADLAIQMALQGRWNEAARINKAIIEAFPADVDAFNRLGKAMTELGRYAEARDAYMKALQVDPLSTIASKNLARLKALGEEAAPPRVASQKLSPQMFIAETGKTGITALVRPHMDIAARLTAGDRVNLHRQNGSLVIQNAAGEYVGEVEPRLAQRLIKLIAGGNEYVAAVSAMDAASISIFIRETFQHATQIGKLSFPPTVSESFRPYVKGRLLRHDADDDTYYEDGDDWEPAGEGGETEAAAYGFAAREPEEIEPGTEEEEE